MGESIEFYQLFGDDAGGKSKISIDKLVNVVFSPCGNYLVAELRYGISFFDCTCLTAPKKISWRIMIRMVLITTCGLMLDWLKVLTGRVLFSFTLRHR